MTVTHQHEWDTEPRASARVVHGADYKTRYAYLYTQYGMHSVAFAHIVRIQSTTKARSKRDRARYGDYRAFYDASQLRSDADGALDLAATLRGYLTSSPRTP